MIFYDFESFTHDWMVVIIDITREYEHETVIVNDCQQLQEFLRSGPDTTAGTMISTS